MVLKQEARRLARELRSIFVLTNSVNPKLRIQLNEADAELSRTVNKTSLRRRIEQTRKDIAKVRRELGVNTPAAQLIEYLERVEAAPPGTELMIPKHVVLELLPGYDYHSEHFKWLPNHARIVIGVWGKFDWFLLETKLYEDLCALFNLALTRREGLGRRAEAKVFVKEVEALMHAVILVAFNFVEAFLNGLALDYYYANKQGLDPQVKSQLLDWDFGKNRPRYLSLREKAIRYQRILLGTEHPPLQESNCTELAVLVGRAKELRDALVHPSPSVELGQWITAKEHMLSRLRFEDAEEIVDSAVGLTRKLENLVHGSEERLFWLHDRVRSGQFPASAFE